MAEPQPDWTRLEGAARQRVADDLWQAWRSRRRRVGVVVGFPGVGKSEHLAAALVEAAGCIGAAAIHVEVLPGPVADPQGVLHDALVVALASAGQPVLAEDVGGHANLAEGLRAALKGGALVILDDIHHLADAQTGERPDWFERLVNGLTQRADDDGWLLLMANRNVDAEWLERCEYRILEAPVDDSAAAGAILDAALPDPSASNRIGDRREEVIRRLGANPRALTLLGHLLGSHTVDELLGPPEADREPEPDAELIKRLEQRILAKAKAGLSDEALRLMRRLTVLRAPATVELLQAVAEDEGDWKAARQALRNRYLLRLRAHGDELNPIVREVELPGLRAEPTEWRTAHGRAGRWYARVLRQVSGGAHPVGPALGGRLEAARYHLTEAQDLEGLTGVAAAVATLLEARFGWSAPWPGSADERDARIALLSAFLVAPGPCGVEFHLAKLLQDRGRPEDLNQALVHAQRATVDQDFSDPWWLWIQLTRELHGLQAGVAAADVAVKAVQPSKNLYTVYQQLGAHLSHLGRTKESIERLWEGFLTARGNEVRLVEQALYCAAAAPTTSLLEALFKRLSEHEGVELQRSLGAALLHQRRGEWTQAVEAAAAGRSRDPHYLHLALHEALSWIGAGQPADAQAALDRFPGGLRHDPRSATTWLAALVSLEDGRLADAAALVTTYLAASIPREAGEVRAVLLREWDHRVAIMGEATPSLNFPVLPAAVTGLGRDAVRPQHGEPVLPASVKTTSSATRETPPAADSSPRFAVMDESGDADEPPPWLSKEPWNASLVDKVLTPGDRAGVHVLGSFDRRITFFNQQVRALLSVRAMHDLGRLRPGTRVVVVGGGAAGCTAALAAHLLGADVHLFESTGLLFERQRHADHRWLHPHVYDWPDRPMGEDRARMPILTWTAGRASDVASELQRDFRERFPTERIHLETTVVHIDGHFIKDSPGFALSFETGADLAFGVVLLAIGFGPDGAAREPRVPGDDTPSYWVPDQLAIRTGEEIVVGGAGDGGLTDAVRAAIAGFQHHVTLRKLLDDDEGRRLADTMRDIDRTAVMELKQMRVEPRDLLHRYETQVKPSQALLERIRNLPVNARSVSLVSNAPGLLRLDTALVNRLAVVLLKRANRIVLRKGTAELRPGDGACIIRSVGGQERSLRGAKLVLRRGPDPKQHFVRLFPEASSWLVPTDERVEALELTRNLDIETWRFWRERALSRVS